MRRSSVRTATIRGNERLHDEQHLRGATATLAMAALCGSLYFGLPSSTTALAAEAAGGSAAAMVVPAAQIDAYGYTGSAPAAASDTGSLVASSPMVHRCRSRPQPNNWRAHRGLVQLPG